ncbi:MAG: phosphoribosyltransferase [Desulfomonile tiedjei]|nr:phosphoribosyltransferase [Desulfomonile tiedjei]
MTEDRIKVHQRIWAPFHAFRNRRDAGVQLAGFLNLQASDDALVLALPRGGVPVAQPLAERLRAPLSMVMVRKLPIPTSPEAGFGAVTIDGGRVLNDFLVAEYGLSDTVIEAIAQEVVEEIRRRARVYLGSEEPPEVRGKDVYVVDDGLASGYTAVAAGKMLRKLEPKSLNLCAPVSPWNTLLTVTPYFDEIGLLFVQERSRFAVASFYEDFHDLTDDEVRRVLAQSGGRHLGASNDHVLDSLSS